MILYSEGQRGLTLQAGDILCIAGRDPRKDIPFEHVAIVAQRWHIESDEDLPEVPCYGLPESTFSTSALTLRCGIWWRNRFPNTIGSARTVWNIVGRLNDIDRLKAEILASELALLDGLIQPKWCEDFILIDIKSLRESGELKFETNCLGWVCSAILLCKASILSTEDFPRYPSPYSRFPGLRISPSPGHLFHAVNGGNGSKPYLPENGAESQRYATAAQTLEDLRNFL